jgi:hypothetical protein
LALAWAVLFVMMAERGEMDVARADVAPT